MDDFIVALLKNIARDAAGPEAEDEPFEPTEEFMDGSYHP